MSEILIDETAGPHETEIRVAWLLSIVDMAVIRDSLQEVGAEAALVLHDELDDILVIYE